VILAAIGVSIMNTKLFAVVLLFSFPAYADENPGINYNGYNTTIYEKGVCFEKEAVKHCFPSVFHPLGDNRIVNVPKPEQGDTQIETQDGRTINCKWKDVLYECWEWPK
jgi:hypothetical protein